MANHCPVLEFGGAAVIVHAVVVFAVNSSLFAFLCVFCYGSPPPPPPHILGVLSQPRKQCLV